MALWRKKQRKSFSPEVKLLAVKALEAGLTPGEVSQDRRRRQLLGDRLGEVFAGDSSMLPDRKTFRKEVREVENNLLGQACSRRGHISIGRFLIRDERIPDDQNS
jgi:hypothetical protein